MTIVVNTCNLCNFNYFLLLLNIVYMDLKHMGESLEDETFVFEYLFAWTLLFHNVLVFVSLFGCALHRYSCSYFPFFSKVHVFDWKFWVFLAPYIPYIFTLLKVVAKNDVWNIFRVDVVYSDTYENILAFSYTLSNVSSFSIEIQQCCT